VPETAGGVQNDDDNSSSFSNAPSSANSPIRHSGNSSSSSGSSNGGGSLLHGANAAPRLRQWGASNLEQRLQLAGATPNLCRAAAERMTIRGAISLVGVKGCAFDCNA